jgi:hypothetical protein
MYITDIFQPSNHSIIHTRTQVTIYMAHFPLLFTLPLPIPLFLSLCIPFYLLGTLLAATGIVHLGLRLLVSWPPLSHPTPKPSPLQIPRTTTAQRLTKTTSGIFRLPLSGTSMYCSAQEKLDSWSRRSQVHISGYWEFGVGWEWGRVEKGEVSLQATWDWGGQDPVTARRVSK